MGDSRGLLLGFEGIAPIDVPQWPKWVNRCSHWYTGRSIRMYRTQVVWLEVDALYASKGRRFGEAVGVGLFQNTV